MLPVKPKILTATYIPYLAVEDLASRDGYAMVADLALYLAEEQDTFQAKKLREQLGRLLIEAEQARSIDANLIEQYRQQITLLSFACLSMQPRRIQEELIRNKFVFAMRAGIDTLELMQQLVSVFQDARSGVEIAGMVMQSLGFNQELIGRSPLVILAEPNPVPPTLANWLRSYNQAFSTTLRRGPIQQAEYLQSNRNVKLLNPDDRGLLEQLLKTYDFLRFPDEYVRSTGPVELEIRQKLGVPGEPIGSASKGLATAGVKESPVVMEVEEPAAAGDTEQANLDQEMLRMYQGDPKFERLIRREQERLVKQRLGKTQLPQEFFAGVQHKQIERVLAILRLLAQRNELPALLQTDQRLQKFLAVTWAKRYGQEFGQQFLAQPAQPKFIRLLLQYVLEERLGMHPNDAARQGAKLGALFAAGGWKEYNRMAYFDVPSKSFRWFSDDI